MIGECWKQEAEALGVCFKAGRPRRGPTTKKAFGEKMYAWTLKKETGQRLECAMPEPVGEQALLETTHCEARHLDLPIAKGVYHLGGGRTLKLSDRGMKLPLVGTRDSREGRKAQSGAGSSASPWKF
ncbi:hypothetical protein V1282_003375 [Nitrobacteraceae bacterium AZCC 2146]